MRPLGHHLATVESNQFRQTYLRAIGAPELSLRTRTRHILIELEKLQPASILDVGCGAGFLTIEAARRLPGSEVVGVDRNKDQINQAQYITHKQGRSNATFILGTARQLKRDFDCVVCSDILHGIPEPLEELILISSLVKPGGTLIIHSPLPPPTGRILRHFRQIPFRGFDQHELFRIIEGEFCIVRARRTMSFFPELAFELAHPEEGPLASYKIARMFLIATLAPLTAIDIGPGGASWLAVARRTI